MEKNKLLEVLVRAIKDNSAHSLAVSNMPLSYVGGVDVVFGDKDNYLNGYRIMVIPLKINNQP